MKENKVPEKRSVDAKSCRPISLPFYDLKAMNGKGYESTKDEVFITVIRNQMARMSSLDNQALEHVNTI